VDRSTQWAVILTAVGIVALALSAATLPSTVSTDSPGGGGANESSSGFFADLEEAVIDDSDIGIPGWILTGLMTLGLVFAAVYVFTEPKQALVTAGVVTAAVAALLAVLFVLSEVFDVFGGGGGGSGSLLSGDGSLFGSQEAASPAVDSSLLAVGLVVGVVLIVAVVALYGATGDATGGAETDRQAAADDSNGIEGVGRAAGRAADRIEAQASVGNEVFRAWREMATRLSADRPETSTPGEFAATATAAGMDPEDVGELTELFEEVRYGDTPPTEERERRALDILRRIEETYADGEDPP